MAVGAGRGAGTAAEDAGAAAADGGASEAAAAALPSKLSHIFFLFLSPKIRLILSPLCKAMSTPVKEVEVTCLDL